MNTCPACSKTVHPNDLVCPHCSIALHPGTATTTPSSGGGMGLSVVMIVIVAVIGIVLVLGCLGAAGFFFVGMPVAAPSPPPVVAPLPVPMHVVPVEELTIDSDPDTPDDQPPASELRKGEPRKDDTTPEQPADPP